MSKLKEKELLEYLEIWKDAFKKAVKKSKLLSMMKKEIQQIELMRIEQAYQQIKEMIQKPGKLPEKRPLTVDEIISKYPESVRFLLNELVQKLDALQKKPEVTEEWYEKRARELITMVSSLYPNEGSPCVIPKSKAKDFIRKLVEKIAGSKKEGRQGENSKD